MEMSESERDGKVSDFTIEHILNKAGEKKCGVRKINDFGDNNPVVSLPWLQCTRYCPPKIPRKREAPQKRQLGRHPRIPFTSHQLALLEEKFQHSPYLSSEEVTKISQELQLADVRVKIWFQNRRARERRERSSTEGGKVKEEATLNYSANSNGQRQTISKQTGFLIPVTSTVFINSSNSLFISQSQFTFQN